MWPKRLALICLHTWPSRSPSWWNVEPFQTQQSHYRNQHVCTVTLMLRNTSTYPKHIEHWIFHTLFCNQKKHLRSYFYIFIISHKAWPHFPEVEMWISICKNHEMLLSGRFGDGSALSFICLRQLKRYSPDDKTFWWFLDIFFLKYF